MQKTGPEAIGIIPARWGSHRFPGKPLALILGKPLIQWTYENSSRSKRLSEVVVATDDERIFHTVKKFGGKVVMTSNTHPTGTERVLEAATRYYPDYPIIVNIQGDEPCISPKTIDAVIDALERNEKADMSTAVTRMDSSLRGNPHIVKCILSLNNKALYFSRAPLPTPFRHIGIYCFWKESLLNFGHLPPSPQQQTEDLEQLKAIENDFSIYCAEVGETAGGVDVPEDVKKVEKILCQENISLLQEVSSLP